MAPMRPLLAFLAFLLMPLPSAPLRAAEPLVADLSSHLVAITTGFAGTDVLLFGAVEEVEGAVTPGLVPDLVVVVRGPDRVETLRRKTKTGAVWINTGEAEAIGAPSFYRVAATRSLESLANPGVLDSHQIGLDHLAFDIRTSDGGASREQYRESLIRLKQRLGLYGDRVHDIGFLGRRLFRTDVHFPANVPVGTYMVEVILLAGGEVVNAQTTPLVIGKIGLGADIYDFAHRYGAAYGILAIALAASAGWLAAVAFRRE